MKVEKRLERDLEKQPPPLRSNRVTQCSRGPKHWGRPLMKTVVFITFMLIALVITVLHSKRPTINKERHRVERSA